jgi:phage terminase large subunit GpA-like protein
MNEYFPALSESIISAIPASGLTVSEWADTYRMLAPERSARPGLWDTGLVPYARAIMDAASDPAVNEIVFMKSAQVAGSEIANNIIGYYMHIEPSPILYVCETEGKARAWSQESLAPMIRDTPALANIVEDARGRDDGNTIAAKKFGGGHLAISWATSAATLSSRPRRIVIFDEVDAFGSTTEGDPISLGEARTKTFPDRKIIKISTPRDDATSRIQPAYDASWKGKYFVPCPHCGQYQTLEWSNIKWEEDNPLGAYYVCELCGVCIDHDDKSEMLARGKWDFDGTFTGSVGFYIWEAYSPFVTWGEMAVSFLKKKKNRDELRAFINTSLAQTWKELEAEIEVGTLPERCELYEAEIPAGVLLLTAGVDVQGDRLEYEILGHGFDQENWSIARGILFGDPSQKIVMNMDAYSGCNALQLTQAGITPKKCTNSAAKMQAVNSML